MLEDGQGREGALGTASELTGAALAALEASRRRIDDLNVYPVPDGDTGTNMTLTVRAIAQALERTGAGTPADLARVISRAALMGARGNSGVILSQIVQGAADSLKGVEHVETGTLALALRAGSRAGYAALRNPQEGTILTVASELASAAERAAADSLELREAVAHIVAHGEVALGRTRDQLDVLREAGVVDAGGAGLLELVRGVAAHLRGEPLPEPSAELEQVPLEAIHQELSRYRYCTSFFVEGADAEPGYFERELERIGDSLLVVGTLGAVKVHVHTDDPGQALALGTAVGVVEEVDVKNMHAQTAAREVRLSSDEAAGAEPALSGVVAVVPGAGNVRLFQSLGAAHVVAGGQSMNPATASLITAIESVLADEVLVLPNNRNVILAAEQAAAAASKPATVVPTRSVQAGLAALVAFDSRRGASENAPEMEEAASAVRSGAVTTATRSAIVEGLDIEVGQYLGLVDEKPVIVGAELEPVVSGVIERIVGGATVLTILTGTGIEPPRDLVQVLAEAHPELEIDVHEGGQPNYAFLFAAE